MTTCVRHQYIIDEVGDLDRLPLETSRHVDACEDCARFGRDLVALRELLREPGRVAAPADFDVRLAARLAAVKAAPPSPRWTWVAAHRAPLAAAACLAVAVSSTLALRSLPAESPVQTPYEVVSAAEPIAPATPPAPESGPTPVAPDPVALETTIAAAPSTRMARAARPAVVRPSPATGDLEIVVQGTGGTHLVSVEPVLYGAQEILPEAVALAGSGAQGSSTTSF
jgi:hypothetical protein